MVDILTYLGASIDVVAQKHYKIRVEIIKTVEVGPNGLELVSMAMDITCNTSITHINLYFRDLMNSRRLKLTLFSVTREMKSKRRRR